MDRDILERLLFLLVFPLAASAQQLVTSERILAETANVEIYKITYKSDDLVIHGTSDWRAKPKTNAINMAACSSTRSIRFE